VPILVLLVVLVVAWLVFSRANEIFFVSVRDGKTLVVRGRLPAGLRSQLAEVVAQPPVTRGSIRAVKTPHGARLATSGIDDARTQRLRNVFGLYPMSQLRRAPIDSNRTLGQILGIAWLAWLLQRR
jgi:hypothetical protein